MSPPQRLRVLRVIGGLDPVAGGPPESAANACIASQRAGVENTMVFPVTSEALPRLATVREQLLQEGIRVHTFGLFPPAGRLAQRWSISPRLVIWLLRQVRRYNVVHIDGVWGLAPLAGALVASRSGRPCVMSPHEALTAFDIEGKNGRVRPVVKKVFRQLYSQRLASIVFSSSIEARDSRLPSQGVRASVIPHPIRGALNEPRLSRPPQVDPLVVGFLGRLHPKKNVDVLIRAVHAASPRARLRIAGDGATSYKHELGRLAAGLGMSDRIEWLGFLEADRRWSFLDTLHVLAMPSRYECFGMAAAEAMARGTPPIVSENTGIAELVKRHECGVVAPATVAGFTRALNTLERETDIRDILAARGPLAARQELSLEGYGAAVRLEYERLVSPASQ